MVRRPSTARMAAVIQRVRRASYNGYGERRTPTYSQKAWRTMAQCDRNMGQMALSVRNNAEIACQRIITHSITSQQQSACMGLWQIQQIILQSITSRQPQQKKLCTIVLVQSFHYWIYFDELSNKKDVKPFYSNFQLPLIVRQLRRWCAVQTPPSSSKPAHHLPACAWKRVRRPTLSRPQ